jgi:hypothetical protein
MSSSYQKMAGVSGVLAGVAGLVYLVSFLALMNPAAAVPALALLAVGVLSTVLIVAVYLRVRDANADAGYATLGLVFGLAGAGGAAIHSAFDLNNILHPPAAAFDYASPIDPRGFLTFGIAGLGAIMLASLLLRAGAVSRGVGYVGIVSGVLLVLLYLAYLIILDALNPVVLSLVLAAGIFEPIW